MLDDDRTPLDRAAARILLGAMFLVAFLLFVLWRTENPRLQSVRSGVVDSVAGTLEAIAGPSDALTGLVTDFRTYADLEAENAQLRRDLARLREWYDAAKRLEAENAMLRALNDVQLPPRLGFVTAEVIADARGPYAQSVIINVGRDDRVENGAPALDATGLVGRVTSVGDASARILLLTDRRSAVPVVVGERRRQAIVQGDQTDRPILRFLATEEGVTPGEIVTTSGDGGVFPAGIHVGRIATSDPRRPEIRLAADYTRLKFVKVSFQNRQEALPRTGGLILRSQQVDDAAAPPAPTPAGLPAPVAGAPVAVGTPAAPAN